MEIHAQKIWRYHEAPAEYRAYFNEPPEGYSVFIVWQYHNAARGEVEWVAPNGAWWNSFYSTQTRVLDAHTNVYLLVETVKST